MPSPAPIDVADEREYAWLLERTDTLTASLMEVWQAIPIAPGSWMAAVVGYPARLLLVGLTATVTGVLVLALVLAVGVTPVTLFAPAEPFLPDGVWFAALGVVAAGVGLYLLLAVIAHLQLSARGRETEAELPAILRDHIVARPVAPGASWQPGEALHISHEWSRRDLFAALVLMLGVLAQFLAVVQRDAWFTGAVDGVWSWGLFFARSLFDTAFLGIPSALVPPWSTIQPAGMAGELVMVAVNLCFAAGFLSMFLTRFASTLRLREVFNGTTRDLADYLHSGDLSDGGALTIHRVAVMRPLDPGQVLSLSKAEFFQGIGGSGDAGAQAEAEASPPC